MRILEQLILWRRMDVPGHDACGLWGTESGWCLAGTAIFALEGQPCHLAYEMVQDIKVDDALLLLTFTLRELWAHRGDNGRLEITTYRSNLGGLDGSVARAAEDVLAARPLPKVEEADLRTAFLSMVSISDEGQFVRHPVRWDALPVRIHSLLERLVQARLLVSRGAEEAPMLEDAPKARILEVAHEALFRNQIFMDYAIASHKEVIQP